ncbi:MAG: DUF1552 domain-containing protein [Myxococcota bacterium]
MAHRIDRRMFLRSASGALLGIPFLSSLLPKTARAAVAPVKKRFVGIQSYSGQIATEWYPTATPAGYQLRNALFSDDGKKDGTTYLSQRIPNYPEHSWAPLTDFSASGVSNIIGTSLNRHLGKMNLLRGLDFLAGWSHTQGGYFGNYAASAAAPSNVPDLPTVDQVLAYSPKFYESAPRKRSLHLGTGSPSSCSYTNYGMAGGPVEEISAFLNPAAAWDEVFRDFMAPNMPRENPNRSLLHAVHDDYARVQRNPRLSALDKQALDRHLSFLSDIESSLMTQTQLACTVPARPRSIANDYPWRDVSSIQDLVDTVSLMIDVAVAAIRCDVTRVVTFNVQKALYDVGAGLVASYHESADVAGDWHQFAHEADGNPTAKRNFVAISKWIAQAVFGAFLDRLDVEEADGKTFLDNSLVVWGNELGYNHYSTDVQTLMAGSAGGALRTGYYVDYIDWRQDYANPIPGWGTLSPGVPHNRWMVTILQSMGLSPSDYESGGRPGYGWDQLSDTPYNWPGYTNPQLGVPLPGITV